jgi:hypothetical protein
MDTLILKEEALRSIETTGPVEERHVQKHLNVQRVAGTESFQK